MSSRLGNKMEDVISVCDREADVYEYLYFKAQAGQRFIVRAVRNRSLDIGKESISDVINESPILGYYNVEIAQKSGRKARSAKVALRSCTVTLKGARRKGVVFDDVGVNVISAIEIGNKESEEKRLSWVILTSESIEDFEEVRNIVRYYEMRWRIEEFHKAWKTGAGAERQRMQSASNLEKMIVILGFVATRLLQLREALEVKQGTTLELTDRKCTEVLTREEFVVLWYAVEAKKNKKGSLPEKIPNLIWAYQAIAKLGGWSNSKRTGKASWLTIWAGWYRLQERLEGFKAATCI